MQAFIDTVRLRSGVFYPGDKDGRLRERGGELGDERDRPAHSHIDRIGTPRLPKRRPRRIIDRAARLDGVGLSDLAARDSDLGAPGACRRRWASTASRCAVASPPGATRILILARARGISVLDAAATDVVSMPITVIAGFAQSRCGTEPVPISDTPSSRPDSARTRPAG